MELERFTFNLHFPMDSLIMEIDVSLVDMHSTWVPLVVLDHGYDDIRNFNDNMASEFGDDFTSHVIIMSLGMISLAMPSIKISCVDTLSTLSNDYV